MKNTIRNKLFLFVKFCIFNILVTVSLHAHAEYYLVYSAPEPSDLCVFCQTPVHKAHPKVHKVVAKKSHRTPVHHKHYSKSGLFVYYPGNLRPSCSCNDSWSLNYCQCCPNPNHVRTQYGDYVVFSSRPADRNYGIHEEEESSYNPDLSTSDDSAPDLEIN